MPYASKNTKVQEIREKLLEELETNKVFVSWKDQDASMVEMIIEGESTVKRERFNSIVEEMLPHGLFDYHTYPQNKVVDWAETHVLFHVN